MIPMKKYVNYTLIIVSVPLILFLSCLMLLLPLSLMIPRYIDHRLSVTTGTNCPHYIWPSPDPPLQSCTPVIVYPDHLPTRQQQQWMSFDTEVKRQTRRTSGSYHPVSYCPPTFCLVLWSKAETVQYVKPRQPTGIRQVGLRGQRRRRRVKTEEE
jgi:hypothetical protein